MKDKAVLEELSRQAGQLAVANNANFTYAQQVRELELRVGKEELKVQQWVRKHNALVTAAKRMSPRMQKQFFRNYADELS